MAEWAASPINPTHINGHTNSKNSAQRGDELYRTVCLDEASCVLHFAVQGQTATMISRTRQWHEKKNLACFQGKFFLMEGALGLPKLDIPRLKGSNQNEYQQFWSLFLHAFKLMTFPSSPSEESIITWRHTSRQGIQSNKPLWGRRKALHKRNCCPRWYEPHELTQEIVTSWRAGPSLQTEILMQEGEGRGGGGVGREWVISAGKKTEKNDHAGVEKC